MAIRLVSCVRLAVILLMSVHYGSGTNSTTPTKHPLYLLSILPYPDPRFSVQPAILHGRFTSQGVRLAIKHINNATGILDDYHIELIEGNGGCDLETLAVETLVRNVFHSGKQIVGIIGPGCSDSAVTVSDMCGHEDISLITIHLGSTPLLADRDRFPNAFSVADTSYDISKAALGLVRYNNWKVVAVLYDVSALVYIDIFRYFEREINSINDYKIAFSAAVFYPDIPLDQLKESFTRTIITFVGFENICRVVCLARHEKLVYPSYQWVFVGNAVECFDSISFTVLGRRYECTAAQQLAASEGITSILGNCHRGEFCEPNFFVQGTNLPFCGQKHIYDGVWSLALALNNSIDVLEHNNLSLSGYSYGHNTITRTIREQLYKVDFCGLTTDVKYGRTTGSKIFSRSLYQYVDGNGSETWIGLHDSNEWNINGNASFLPYQFSSTYIHVSYIATTTSLLITGVTTVLVVAAHILNVFYRNQDSVKASSPRLNHLVYSGCYCILISVCAYILFKSFQFEYILYSVLCNFTLWFVSTGSTLILGTVCVKTLRLYSLFIRSAPRLKSDKKFQDHRLAIFILMLLSVDIIMCTIWSSVDALVQQTTDTLELGGGEPRIEVEYHCQSESNIAVVISVVLTLYKVILLAGSTCLAFLTRRIYIKRFPTTHVTLLVYSICLIRGLGFPLYFVTDQRVNRNILHSVEHTCDSMLRVSLCSTTTAVAVAETETERVPTVIVGHLAVCNLYLQVQCHNTDCFNLCFRVHLLIIFVVVYISCTVGVASFVYTHFTYYSVCFDLMCF